MTGPVTSAAGTRVFGLTEWFRPGEHERVERCLEHLAGLGAGRLRTHLSWADYYQPGGREWYDWLIPTIARQVDLLPCVHFTPPSISVTGTTAGPPARPRDLADFLDVVLTRHGEHFDHVELWNEPNNLLDWDWREDPSWLVFCEMVGAAAYWAEHRGWRAVLGGPCPFDLNWFDLMGQRGVLGAVSAVSIHGFPGTWDTENGIWGGWDEHIGQLRGLLGRYNDEAEIWITEAGYSTWRHDELEQARRFIEAIDAPADRLYWYALADMPPETPVQEGRQFDMRHYHVGLLDTRWRDKLLAQLLREGGIGAVRRRVKQAAPASPRGRPVLITGGAGFIGSNLADAFLAEGHEVIVYDNLSRPGVSANVDWLRARHGRRAIIQAADVRDATAIAEAARSASAVVHLAGQVAVTESLESPLEDFTVNAAGTLHLLEALRRKGAETPLVFASTNKVYGALQHVRMERTDGGHVPADPELRRRGLDETTPLQFCTPYGCSKGAADQYVLDYAASFGLPAVVLRMSCIYGPRQLGTEDQGWVAHFVLKALGGQPITIFGDGWQVRDVLHVADAVRAYRLVLQQARRLCGRAFNLGGGPDNAVSLRRMLEQIERLDGCTVETRNETARKGDQLYFACDTRALDEAVGWRARIGWQDGLRDLHAWLQANRAGAARRAVPTQLSVSA